MSHVTRQKRKIEQKKNDQGQKEKTKKFQIRMDDSVENDTSEVFLDFVDYLAAKKGTDRDGAVELMATLKPKKLAKKRKVL